MLALRRTPAIAACVVVGLMAGCSSGQPKATSSVTSTTRGPAGCGSGADVFHGKSVAVVEVTSHKRLPHGVDTSYVQLTGRVVTSDRLAVGSTVSWVQANSVVTRSTDDSVADGARAVVLLTAPSARRFATETFTEVAGRAVAFGVVDPQVREHLRSASLDAVYAFLVSCVQAN